MREKHTAYIYMRDGLPYFKFYSAAKGEYVEERIITSPFLLRFLKIKEYDNGYMVADIELSTMGIIEEYFDFEYEFNYRGIPVEPLYDISEVIICG